MSSKDMSTKDASAKETSANDIFSVLKSKDGGVNC